MSTAPASPTPAVDPAYLALIHRHPLRPIATAGEYDAAVALMNELIDGERSPGQDDYLHVLGTLIGEYDDEHHPIDEATPGAILRGYLDDRKVSQAELARATGITEGNISMMLKDQRGIGKNARAAFAQFFGVEPTDFVVE